MTDVMRDTTHFLDLVEHVEDWKKASEEGKVCGMYGCFDQPVEFQCKYCKNHYCEEHKKIHFHAIK